MPVVLYPVLDEGYGCGRRGIVVDELVEDVGQALELLYHWRHNHVEHSAQHHYQQQHCDDNAEGAARNVQTILYESHHRIDQIGQEPGNDERQQNAAQRFHYQQHSHRQDGYERPSERFVECNWLSHDDDSPFPECPPCGGELLQGDDGL